jgi:hypothetical protein
MCIASIFKTLTVENVLEALQLAYAHEHLGDFKARVLKFAKENAKAIAALPELNVEFNRENPEIVIELHKQALM